MWYIRGTNTRICILYMYMLYINIYNLIELTMTNVAVLGGESTQNCGHSFPINHQATCERSRRCDDIQLHPGAVRYLPRLP